MNQENLIDHFRQEFFQEAREILESISDDLLRLEADPENDELLNAIFRGIHTIKGSAGSFELMVISDFTHHLEGLLNALRDKHLSLSSDLVDVILSGSDQIGEMIEICAAGSTPDQNEELIERMVACLPSQQVAEGNDHDAHKDAISSGASAPEAPLDALNGNCEPQPDGSGQGSQEGQSPRQDAVVMVKKEAVPEGIYDALVKAAAKGSRLFKIILNYTSGHFENGYDPMVFLNHLYNATSFYHVTLRDAKPMPGLDTFEPLHLYLNPILYVATDMTEAEVLDLLFDEDLITVESLLTLEGEKEQQKAASVEKRSSDVQKGTSKGSLMDEIVGSQEAMAEFIDGAMDMLQVAEKAVMAYETHGEISVLDELFRAVHNLKGDADLMGFQDLVLFCHAFESFLDMLRTEQLERDLEIVELALQSVDFIKSAVTEISASRPVPSLGSLYKSVLKYIQGPPDHGAESDESLPPGHWITDEELRAAYIEQILQFKAILIQCMESAAMEDEKGAQGLSMARTLNDICRASKMVGHDLLQQAAAASLDGLQRIEEKGEEKRAGRRTGGDKSDVWAHRRLMDDLMNPVMEAIDALIGEPRKLGEILVSEGKIKEADLSEALSSQKPIGQILLESGKVSEEDLGAALNKQKRISTSKKTKSEEAPTTVKTMRVDEQKVESFSNLVGEMLIARNTYSYLLNRLTIAQDPDETQEAVKELKENLHLFSRLTNDVQHGVISLRMIPVRGIFQKFARVVRDISRKQNKMIHMMTDGEEIEIDKKVADILSDPLIHLIRNACDHGIETPLERKKAGKPEKGTVLLKAAREGSNIVIRINDDGRGINRAKLLEKAKKEGLNFTSEDDPGLLDIIFMPGLSTAEKITDVSGRGVGMDVVKTSIQSLGGSVSVMSEEGQGSQLTLTLPTSMGIDTVLLVASGKNAYAFPISYILETLKVRPDRFIRAGNQLMFHYRGEVLSAHFLEDLMAGREGAFFQDSPDPLNGHPRGALGKSSAGNDDGTPEEISMVILKTSQDKYGVIVDGLDKNMEIAVKPLPEMLSDLDIISGISILGDGQVLLIINPEKLAQ